DESMFHTRQRLDLIDVGAGDLASENRTLYVVREKHVRRGEINSKDWFSGDDLVDVRIRRVMPDDPVVLRILHLQRLGIGGRQRRGFSSQLTIAGGSLAGLMMDAAGSRGAFRFRHAPRLRRSADQHLAATGADLAQRFPVQRRGGASAGDL